MSYHCERCGCLFGSLDELYWHERSSVAHYICDNCNVDFSSRQGLVQHWVQTPSHIYCQTCDRHFNSSQELEVHYKNMHYYCKDHRKFFKSALGLSEHYRQAHCVQTPYYCVPCNRYFQNPNNLDAHLRSSTHQPLRYTCPGGGCAKRFISVAALILHFESGKCPARITRDAVDRYVAQVDRAGVITDRLLRGPDGAPAPRPIRWASELAWNGYGFECYVCHREFDALQQLNAHLGSSTHDERVYRCPRAYGGCDARFALLSALCQHVESGQCAVHRFKKDIDDFINDGLARGMRAVTA